MRRGIGGIFGGPTVLGLGDSANAPAGESQGTGAGTGTTEWVMDWASGQEATPVGQSGQAGQLLSMASPLLSAAQSFVPMGAGDAPLLQEMQERAAHAAIAAQQAITGQWIPGVPNVVLSVGAAAAAAGVLYLLLRRKK